jgi:hypothetical protein
MWRVYKICPYILENMQNIGKLGLVVMVVVVE